ncbi:MAG TPA: Sec-dependent nitrous-oxide reductase [Leptospiraceae bacterium]|nr:Sec-dependent nitrous-oxide reductase [Leptospiraceae bacterium]HMX31719.1 Sec-dependent nitrous-oxide reductase [Leptospiraceae bacterium]HMY32005.1 Sec-dependent nitrous-oxide reductase [Leptospiraceae bacterium]HMZ65782.1 Sec-dependent nitrous-oxide reductase [Leptospiraceae bacterium]HNA09864.1 Sec-dependent nitrous-oxide reductase [Leptospiraceae bacterium]
MRNSLKFLISLTILVSILSCGKKQGQAVLASNAAQKVYVAPGEKDEVYLFTSGGFNGQIGVYGIPSGRLFKIIPVFSLHSENSYGYDDETKDMLLTSKGYVAWDDTHHPEISLTGGNHDGRWLFINGNNTPRIARLDLTTFETKEIIEIPNTAGGHGAPFITENTEYAISTTRFSVPIPQRDIAIEEMGKGNFNGTISMVKVDPKDGKMSLDLQMLVPGFSYDLTRCGKGPSHDWCFFSTYNTEQAYQMIEVGASKNDKDYVMAFNWVKAKACKDAGKAKDFSGTYYHNYQPENAPAIAEKMSGVKLLNPKDCPGVAYFMPTPKSPHGADVDPTGEYIAAGGKLASVIAVHSYSKLLKATEDKANFTGEVMGIPILKYEATLAGEVKKPCLGPLHTEFDNNGYAYTSCFVSSEVVKWKPGTWEVVQHMPAFYSIGHLSIVGGDNKKPYGKYLVAMNKITKDRYLPVGMELPQSAQLWDISGSTAELLLDFPTVGEPHYAQMIPAAMIKDKTKKIFPLEENKHPYGTKSEKDAKIVKNGNQVHIYMTSIRSHFKPDKVEVKKGDVLYFHVTNLEQDFDVPHGFAINGSTLPNLLIMPGQTKTMKWEAKEVGVYPFYCTDFCSALHQEMQQYIRVSP